MTHGNCARAFLIAKWAIRTAGKHYPGQASWLTEFDAFRHTIWNALLTVDFGADMAKTLTDYHEQIEIDKYDLRKWRSWQITMDFYNNEVGRELGKQCSGSWFVYSCVEKKVAQAMKDGLLLIIEHDPADMNNIDKWVWKWSDGAPVYWIDGRPSRTPPPPPEPDGPQ